LSKKKGICKIYLLGELLGIKEIFNSSFGLELVVQKMVISFIDEFS
jgi:hypothetical protein